MFCERDKCKYKLRINVWSFRQNDPCFPIASYPINGWRVYYVIHVLYNKCLVPTSQFAIRVERATFPVFKMFVKNLTGSWHRLQNWRLGDFHPALPRAVRHILVRTKVQWVGFASYFKTEITWTETTQRLCCVTPIMSSYTVTLLPTTRVK